MGQAFVELVTLFCEQWKEQTGTEIHWIDRFDCGPHEAGFLKLDCSKLKTVFGWTPRWHVEETMKKIVEWSSLYISGGDVSNCMEEQIREFCHLD